MVMKGKQTVKHLQGLVHNCRNTAAVCIVRAARYAWGQVMVCIAVWAHRGGLNPLQCLFLHFKCIDKIIMRVGRFLTLGIAESGVSYCHSAAVPTMAGQSPHCHLFLLPSP